MKFTADYFEEIKKENSRGRCLHFLDDVRCNNIISAHSIQKSGQLDNIAENGHVYRLSTDLSTLLKTNGLPIPKKIGVYKASTFAGFCKHHDNHLFKPIDTQPLAPNKQQIALYAYRCLCREYFVKENAVAVLEKMKDRKDLNKEKRELLASSLKGHLIGLRGLKHHKAIYDKALQYQNYDEFEFTCFTSKSPCELQVSGLLYPDYDFCGYQLQDLSNRENALSLITYFTAPTSDGWAFGFGWHKSSSNVCIAFLESLAERFTTGEKIEDALLRFSFTCCENHAFRISWWDNLVENAKLKILEKMWLMVSPFTPIYPNYLVGGCEEIATWTYEEVFTTISVQD